MITEDYVSFETAKLLKEKGFDGIVTKSYDNHTHEFLSHCAKNYGQFNAPTLQMAMKWLRDVHGIAIVVVPSMFWGRYNTTVYKKGNDYPIGFDGDSLCPSYEEACEAAIKYCLENLI